MRIALTCRAAMTRLAELSGPEYPPHVQVKAVLQDRRRTLTQQPRHADVRPRPRVNRPCARPNLSFSPGQHPYAALLIADLDVEDDE